MEGSESARSPMVRMPSFRTTSGQGRYARKSNTAPSAPCPIRWAWIRPPPPRMCSTAPPAAAGVQCVHQIRLFKIGGHFGQHLFVRNGCGGTMPTDTTIPPCSPFPTRPRESAIPLLSSPSAVGCADGTARGRAAPSPGTDTCEGRLSYSNSNLRACKDRFPRI